MFYVFENEHGSMRFTRADLTTAGALAEIDPDSKRWRAMFPGERRHGIDTVAAAGWLIGLCRAAQARRDAATANKSPDSDAK
jgi:hypothetical protein